MLTINGERVSPIDPAELPFSVNRAAGPNFLIPISIFLAFVMGTSNLLGYTSIPLYLVFAPPVLLAAHVISFIRLRNAVHMALQMHLHDVKLQLVVEESQAKATTGHLSQDRLQAITRNRAG